MPVPNEKPFKIYEKPIKVAVSYPEGFRSAAALKRFMTYTGA